MTNIFTAPPVTWTNDTPVANPNTFNLEIRDKFNNIITNVVDKTTAQTLTNKTLTSPVINTPTGDIATLTGIQTLTNKTLTSPVIDGIVTGTAGFLKSKLISATRDMTADSGNVTYTGVGFTPTGLQSISGINGGFAFSVGYADSLEANSVIATSAAGVTDIGGVGGGFIILYTGAGAYQIAYVYSYIADGFILTWGKNGSPTGVAWLNILCLR